MSLGFLTESALIPKRSKSISGVSKDSVRNPSAQPGVPASSGRVPHSFLLPDDRPSGGCAVRRINAPGPCLGGCFTRGSRPAGDPRAPTRPTTPPPDSASRCQRKCNERRHEAASGRRENGQRRKRDRRREGAEMSADEALKLRASRRRLEEKSRLYDQMGAHPRRGRSWGESLLPALMLSARGRGQQPPASVHRPRRRGQ